MTATINNQDSSQRACVIRYGQDQLLYLADDSGNFTPGSGLVPEEGGAAWNSQCTIDAYSSWVQPSGTQLTLNVYSWFTGMARLQNQYLEATDVANLTSETLQVGFWNAVHDRCVRGGRSVSWAVWPRGSAIWTINTAALAGCSKWPRSCSMSGEGKRGSRCCTWNRVLPRLYAPLPRRW